MKNKILAIVLAAAIAAVPFCAYGSPVAGTGGGSGSSSGSHSSGGSGGGGGGGGGGGSVGHGSIMGSTTGEGNAYVSSGPGVNLGANSGNINTNTANGVPEFVGENSEVIRYDISSQIVSVIGTDGNAVNAEVKNQTATVLQDPGFDIINEYLVKNTTLNEAQRNTFMTSITQGIQVEGAVRKTVALVRLDNIAVASQLGVTAMVNQTVWCAAAPGTVVTYSYVAENGVPVTVKGTVDENHLVVLNVPAGVTTVAELQ